MIDQSETSLYAMLQRLRSQLKESGDRIVLAESCTSGLVAAELGQIPGISESFCGSMVVYRTTTKTAWLDIEPKILLDPSIGPVSHEVTKELLFSILERTPEASVAASITGHLGPNSPEGMDGLIFCGFARRSMSQEGGIETKIQRQILRNPAPVDENDFGGRRARQSEAACSLISWICQHL